MGTPAEKVSQLLGANRKGNGGSGGGRAAPPSASRRPTRWLVGSAIVLIFAIWGFTSLSYTVQPEERAVVKRFGKVVEITEPGLHFKIPFGVERVELVATERVLKQEFGFRTVVTDNEKSLYAAEDFPDESLMLSGDLNIIDVEWVVQYRISDPVKFLYNQRDAELTLRDISESVMRRVVGNRLGSEVLTTARVAISNQAGEEIQAAMTQYDNGIHVVTLELQDVVPPAAVKPAFNEVNEARQERERMINEATKRANQELPRARGEANRAIAESQGYATERINQAKGETARFNAILAEYRVAPEVTRTRMYLEALNQLLPRVGGVYVAEDGKASPFPLLNLRERAPTQLESK